MFLQPPTSRPVRHACPPIPPIISAPPSKRSDGHRICRWQRATFKWPSNILKLDMLLWGHDYTMFWCRICLHSDAEFYFVVMLDVLCGHDNVHGWCWYRKMCFKRPYFYSSISGIMERCAIEVGFQLQPENKAVIRLPVLAHVLSQQTLDIGCNRSLLETGLTILQISWHSIIV